MSELETRVEELQRELAGCKAELEASVIHAEQTNQAIERRYEALMDKHGSISAEKERMGKENAELNKMLTEARQESHRLQTQLMKAESDQERQKLEIESLERDKVGLTKLLGEARDENEEIQMRLQSSADKILSLTKANSDLDMKLQSALAEKCRTSLDHNKIEQEKVILEKSNAWLNEELDRKMKSSNEERQKATRNIIELQNKVHESEIKIEQMVSDQARLQEHVQQQEQALQSLSRQLKDTKEELAQKEQNFETELGLAQRMAQLYKESADEHSKRNDELEGIVAELKRHMDESAKIHEETIGKLEQACRDAEKKALDEKELRERVVDAAATASWALTPPKDNEIEPLNGQNMTPTELYGKFIEAQEKLRAEKMKNREKEIYMEELLVEVERRAALVSEQQREYDSMKSNHSSLIQEIEELSMQKRKIQQALRQAETDLKVSQRERKSLEQQIKDLGQQVAKLLHEATNKTRQELQKSSSDFSGGTASDVTTEFLVEFSSIQELQQQNQKLLRINRDLSEAAEASKEEAQRELREQYEDKIDQLKSDLQELRNNRENAEQILEQVVRQRDTLRKLLQNAGGDLGQGHDLYVRSLGQEFDRVPRNGTNDGSRNDGDGEDVSGSDFREMYEDLEKEFNAYKTKSNSAYVELEKELLEAKHEILAVKKEAAQSQAQAAFEKDRSGRLSASLDSQQKHIESLLASNAKYQALMTETERKLAVVQQSCDKAEEMMRSLNMKLEALTAENGILENAEKRLAAETASLSQEKFKLAAKLDISEKQYHDLEARSVQDISKYQSLASKATSDLADSQRELAITKARAENAIKEASQIKEEMEIAVSKLEKKLEVTNDELSKMQQRANSAEAKADLLQEAVRKAEEKVARLEMEKATRASTSQEQKQPEEGRDTNLEGADSKLNELYAEVKILREELSAAQEAAAASTGHAKQFETLAHTAEEALKSVQEEHDRFKREAVSRINSVEMETNRLRAEVSEKERLIKASKEIESTLREECNKITKMMEAEKENLRQDLQQASDHLQKEKEKLSRLSEDEAKVRVQLQEVKKSYDAEVVAHGDALRRLGAAESSISQSQARLHTLVNDLERERSLRAQSESEHKSKIEDLSNQVKDLSNKIKSLTEQRDTLQHEIEKMAGENQGDFSNSMRMLRQEREAAEINLQLAERELVRLRQEVVIAKRSAEEARCELAAQLERQAVKKTEKQEENVQHLEQLNILRESNVALRAGNAEKDEKIAALEGKIEDLEKSLDPLKLRIKDQESAIMSIKEEVKIAEETAKRWETRANTLGDKTNTVDAAEHDKLANELQQAKIDLENAKSELDKVKQEKELLDKRLQETGLIAHNANAKLAELTKQVKSLSESNKSLPDMQKKNAEQNSTIIGLQQKCDQLGKSEDSLKEKVIALEKKMEAFKSQKQRLLANFEKSVSIKKDIEAERDSLKAKLSSLQEEMQTFRQAEKQENKTAPEAEGDEQMVQEENLEESSVKRKIPESEQLPEDQARKKLRPSAPTFTPSSRAPETHDHGVQETGGEDEQNELENETKVHDPKTGNEPQIQQVKEESLSDTQGYEEERQESNHQAGEEQLQEEQLDEEPTADVEREVSSERQQNDDDAIDVQAEDKAEEEADALIDEEDAEADVAVEDTDLMETMQEDAGLDSGKDHGEQGDAPKPDSPSHKLSKVKRTKIEWKESQIGKPARKSVVFPKTAIKQPSAPSTQKPTSSTIGQKIPARGKEMLNALLSQTKPSTHPGSQKEKDGEKDKDKPAD